MTRLGKCLAIASTVLVPVGLVAIYISYVNSNLVPSDIVDFKPEEFPVKADAQFFYSVGNDLKYSDQIDVQAPTLIRGNLSDFLVSPDGKKIAIVVDGQLVVVGTESVLRRVNPVDSIFREEKPIGQEFWRDDDFQWSKDSKALYLIRDEYYNSKGLQLFSSKGELWRYDFDSGNRKLVVKPFPAHSYFFGKNDGIYFSTPTEKGDLQLRYFDGTSVTDVGQPNAKDLSPANLGQDFVEAPFFSFSIFDYQKVAGSSKGVDLSETERDQPQQLVIGGTPYLALTLGMGFKGSYYCSEMLRSVFLPGDRYFLFNVPSCGNYKGQLLIDTVTGKYQRLPADSRVYLTLNTLTHPHYKIAGEGLVVN